MRGTEPSDEDLADTRVDPDAARVLAALRGASSEVRAQFINAYVDEMRDDEMPVADIARAVALVRRLISQ
jgi:hypothetical protein